MGVVLSQGLPPLHPQALQLPLPLPPQLLLPPPPSSKTMTLSTREQPPAVAQLLPTFNIWW